ncbi:hypothetical protein A2707_03745 [Candidatus Saccharibacteria bacterium RIFCSPHIGHO2_01_FULL_45_15]|nr:MAG: hypothetical protein A2707_03745 [Candidatus Saccharibacteria bacterium RIFCSPHIGHO2_01_FULL_45_15]OGL28693.1 MAG: hypothetical protein A3C39_05565 [Candidatus Saccharibacteria bacterium RIFCSPHIGHO2_02_FULL_46_12]OGL31496.1 MAG: hypothetical protein A3E76_03750 [Candidatus Saccharibacteria bacterium RIFCSPHIGHO2_12_FULL_44_22]
MAKSNHESKHKPEVKEKTSVDKAKPTDDKGWDTGTVLLGVGLITAGIVFLLGTLNIVDIYLGNIWQLWPLVIVGVGISFLHLKGAWKNSVVGLFIVASLGLLYVTITNEEGGRLVGSKDENRKQSEVAVGKKANSVDSLDLKIETGAMKVVIDPLNGSQIAKAMLDGNRRFELKADTTVSNTTQQTTISTKGSGFGWTGLSNNKLNVQITKDIPVMLRMDAGAASLDANLADIRIKEFTVDAGASSLKATIGNKEDTVKVSIDAGASSITLRVPKDSGVRVESEGGLSSKNFEDIYEVSNGVYESKDYNQAAKKITIISDVGASSIKIERY